MGFVEDIEKLNKLKQDGAISEQEYQEAKDVLLAKNRPAGEKLKKAIDGIAPDDNMWGVFIHLSQFCGFLVPLAGGLPMGAVLINAKAASAIERGDHATTFGGGLVVSAAAIEVVKKLKKSSFLAAVTEKGEHLLHRLESLKKQFPALVASARGLGLLTGLELKIDAAPVVDAFRARGVLVCVAGPRVVRVVPPLTISLRQIDTFIETFIEVLKASAQPEKAGK